MASNEMFRFVFFSFPPFFGTFSSIWVTGFVRKESRTFVNCCVGPNQVKNLLSIVPNQVESVPAIVPNQVESLPAIVPNQVRRHPLPSFPTTRRT